MLTREEIEKALDKIRPNLAFEGGGVELVEFSEDGTVKVKLTGACQSCPMAQMTLRIGIEKVLKENIPEIKKIEAIF